MEACWEFFECDKTDCPARTSGKPCWETEGTMCKQFKFAKEIDNFDNIDFCKLCIYKKKYGDTNY